MSKRTSRTDILVQSYYPYTVYTYKPSYQFSEKDAVLATPLHIYILDIDSLRHRILRRGRGGWCRKNVAQRVKSGGLRAPALLRELDVELNVQIAVIVVPRRGHALAGWPMCRQMKH